ncbi:MAG: vWA domain-containing protein [Gemmataceae bacterium]
MPNLPDLQQYQLITFNTRVEFPLGKPGGWLDYNPRTTADEVVRLLARIEPTGGTDMHAAVQSAFTYRGNGLDTVYLLSDGLPNQGDGTDEATARGLKGVDRSTYLGRKVRTRLLTEWNRPLPRIPQVKVNTVGFFYESPDLGAFLWALARENGGNFVGMSQP